MTRFVPALALAILIALAIAPPTRAATTEIPVVRIENTTTIAAAPAAVWTWLTTGKNLITWCPVWKSESNKSVHLTKVGDALDFTDQWGNGGRSVVTFIAPNKELRVAHEPTDGSYLCQSRVILKPAGSGTEVTWIEQYTDASSATDKAATATKMETEMDATLGTLKASVETK
ncbi:MAG TPA: SRPBCC family protein [Candidatus Eisenbacteria bacterium]